MAVGPHQGRRLLEGLSGRRSTINSHKDSASIIYGLNLGARTRIMCFFLSGGLLLISADKTSSASSSVSSGKFLDNRLSSIPRGSPLRDVGILLFSS